MTHDSPRVRIHCPEGSLIPAFPDTSARLFGGRHANTRGVTSEIDANRMPSESAPPATTTHAGRAPLPRRTDMTINH